MFEASFSERKKWVAVIFIVAYLLPLSCLFVYQVILKSIAKQAWVDLLTLTVLFGLPLVALWIAVAAYPTFRKGARPFQSRKSVQWIIFFFLAQGALLSLLCVLYPTLFLLNAVSFAYEPFILGVAMLVGLVGLPAAVFACGVILKQVKEVKRAAA
jgi:hypothetical protein